MKRIIIGIIALVLAVTGLTAMLTGGSASATGGDEPPCVPTDAWTETIEHPAVTHEETVPGTAEVWANFQPTKPKTFVGPPSWPTDPRGKWTVHTKIPGGHEGPDGVYSKGNPHKGGNWFYRQAGTPDTVIVVVDEEARTEVIEHPAVTCPEDPDPTCEADPSLCEPPLTCEDEGYEPVGDECEVEEPPVEEPETPEEPTDDPETPETPDGPKTTTEQSCTSSRCVVTETEIGTGKVVSKKVTEYPADAAEEGF